MNRQHYGLLHILGIGAVRDLRRAGRRMGRLFGLLLTAILLFNSLTSATLSAPPRDDSGPVAPVLAPPVAYAAPLSPTPIPSVTPTPPPHLPSLSLDVALSAASVAVGDLVTITLTVHNEAPDAAAGLVLTLPVPSGTVGVPDVGPRWTWTPGHLDGQHDTVLTATLRVTETPAGGALLLQPQATAQGLPQPVGTTSGALVLDRAQAASTVRFTPGARTVLTSPDGLRRVDFPTGGFDRPLTLRHSVQPPPPTRAPPPLPFHRGLGAFYLTATDDANQAVHQFAQPLTITVAYTAQQLQALGLAEADLALFWYDETTQQWQPVATTVDSAQHMASATVSHFSDFQLGDTSSPSAAFIPTLQGFQVGLYTGDVQYAYPLDLPAGPGGIKPDLQLSYDSAATDGRTGLRPHQQAGWAGKGWSLSPSFIGLQKLPSGNQADSRYYSLALNGQSFDLVRGAALVTTPTLTDPTNWEWHPTDETFIRAQAVYTAGLTGRGDGSQRYAWEVWTKDGTRYEFAEDAWWGWQTCTPDLHRGYFEPYKWYLSQVTDPHGNTINYAYKRASETRSVCDDGASGTTDYDVWPITMTWGANINTNVSDRYEVTFTSTARTMDTDFARAPAQIGRAPQETRELDQIGVWSRQAGTWEPVREYDLTFDTLNPVRTDDLGCNPLQDPSCNKLTLKQLTRKGKDGSALPAMTFTYGHTVGTGTYPNGEWNRLVSADNGQGGVVSFTYENIGNTLAAAFAGDFRNNRRVTSKTLTSNATTPAVSSTWHYTDYQDPAYNSLGTDLKEHGPQAYPNSAVLYFNAYFGCRDTPCDNTAALVHPPNTEFRGHSSVTEIDPNSKSIQHFFYQGQSDEHCTPTAEQEPILTDPCFLKIRDREMEKGREYRTIHYANTTSGPELSEDQHFYGIDNLGNYGQDVYSDDRLVGLWRFYQYETQTLQLAFDGATTPATQTITYTYDLSGTDTYSKTYGNLLALDEFDGSARLRHTEHTYTVLDDATTYIVDRKRSDNVYDDTGNKLARTVYSYDNDPNWGGGVMGNHGDLTLMRKYDDLGCGACDPIHSSDTSYGYDPYGNVVTTTTYLGPGTQSSSCAEANPLAPCWSPPGAGSATRTITTTYDLTFHTFPTEIDQPQLANGQTLREQANYDYRMGTLTVITDTNNNVTTAGYDAFGRLTSVVKPGDSPSVPTVQAFYNDTAIPFQYIVTYTAQSGVTTTQRPVQQFYDGLGRLIQTKNQYVPVTIASPPPQTIVVDQVYDGLNQQTQISQPRYVTETLSSFYQYTPPSGDRWTTTSYDALGRPLTVQAPDATQTVMTYTLNSGLRATRTLDANSHQTEHDSDVFGRLRQVIEYTGTAPSWSPYATTVYTYNQLDLLTQVTDAQGYTTTMGYDSLGRKTSMHDPDMGDWTYAYDVNGNLITQTNALTQTFFSYDVLDRLTQQSHADGSGFGYNYDESGVPNGLGRRTSLGPLGAAAQEHWQYDARGNVAALAYNHLPGLSASMGYTFTYSYDSGDRPYQTTYPGGEQVTTTYDGAWRPLTLCSGSYTPCYVTAASYTALDQPAARTTGNGWTQTWGYSSPMARLGTLQIGPTGGALAFNRSYNYDPVGNVTAITNTLSSEVQQFSYDARDRLSNWTVAGSINQSYAYDAIGNLTSKAGTSYSYGPQAPYNGGPHAVRNVGGTSYTYDALGNLTSQGSARTYTWNADQQPTSISSGGTTEQYSYDGAGERLTRTAGGVTTFYLAGLVEEDWQSGAPTATRTLYSFNGAVVAERNSSLTYLHGDHLGSVSLASGSGSTPLSQQEFDPWGAVRSGGVGQTALNYTGQRLDGTGLLYYHARYYDPALARWVSPDTLVPGMALGASGALGTLGQDDKVALRPLTVDFHEPGVVAGLNEEDQFTQQKGFWFQLSSDEQGKAKTPWGPANPQALNRYSYVLNNPLRYTDPTGHVLTQSYWWGTRIALSAEDLKAIAHVLLEYSSEEIIGALVLAGFGEEEAAIIAAAAIFLGPTALLAIAEAHNHLEIYLIGGLPLLWAEIHGGDEPPTDLSNLQPANPIKWPECKGGCSGSYPTGGGVIPVQPTPYPGQCNYPGGPPCPQSPP